jgi:hypothetical protein
MQSAARFALAAVWAIGLGWGCSCVPGITACNNFAKANVVVVGKVIRDTGAGLGTGLGRIAVEEILHGLPRDVREIDVNTSPMSSCYMRLALNERYLLFGSVENGVLFSGFCAGSRNLAGNELLLDALRQAEAHGPSRLVGTVGIGKSLYGSDERAGAGLRVVAIQGDQRRETQTVSGGQFEFRDVTPGVWELRVDSPGLVHRGMWPREPIRVPPGGCEYRSLDATGDGRISGRVTDAEGKPVAGVMVQAFNFDHRGILETSPFGEARTGAGGEYEIRGLPEQPYIVAVNGRKHHDEGPYRAVYYPGTSDALSAKRVPVRGIEVTPGIDLVVSPRRVAAQLIVEAVDEEGNPLDAVGAKTLDLNGAQRAASASVSGKDGLSTLAAWEGETYLVEAFRVKTISPEEARKTGARIPIDMREGKAGPVQVTAPVTRIRVVLRPKR